MFGCISTTYKVFEGDSPRKKLLREIFVGCENKEVPIKPLLPTISQTTSIKLKKIDVRIDSVEIGEYDQAWRMIVELMDSCEYCTHIDMSAIYSRASFIRNRQGHYDYAAFYLTLAINVHPEYDRETIERYVLYVGHINLENGNYKAALRYYQNWEALCPSNVPNTYFSQRVRLHKILDDKLKANKYEEWGALLNGM